MTVQTYYNSLIVPAYGQLEVSSCKRLTSLRKVFFLTLFEEEKRTQTNNLSSSPLLFRLFRGKGGLLLIKGSVSDIFSKDFNVNGG